jgi:hypothetical protein
MEKGREVSTLPYRYTPLFRFLKKWQTLQILIMKYQKGCRLINSWIRSVIRYEQNIMPASMNKLVSEEIKLDNKKAPSKSGNRLSISFFLRP